MSGAGPAQGAVVPVVQAADGGLAVTWSVRWWATMLSQVSSWPGPAPVTARPRSALRSTTMLVAALMPWPATSPTQRKIFPEGRAMVSYQSPTRVSVSAGR